MTTEPDKALSVRARIDAALAEIISDDEITRVHGGANFGRTITPRQVVNDGVRKYAVGYESGYTQLHILMHHGLITKPRPGTYQANLTKKGKRYARIVLFNEHSDLSRKLETATGLLRESREHVLCVRDHETVERIDAFLSSS